MPVHEWVFGGMVQPELEAREDVVDNEGVPEVVDDERESIGDTGWYLEQFVT